MLRSSDALIRYLRQSKARLLIVLFKNKIIQLKEIRAKLQDRVIINFKIVISSKLIG